MRKFFLLFLFLSTFLKASNEEVKISPYHEHFLYFCNLNNGWTCDNPSICPHGYSEEYKTSHEKRYRCKVCDDFDLCKKCVDDSLNGQYETPWDNHKLSHCYIDNGWTCNNLKGCKSGITTEHQSGGIDRYRCEKCNFDLCHNCLFDENKIYYNPCFYDDLEKNEFFNTDKCKKCSINEQNSLILHKNSSIGHMGYCKDCAKLEINCPICKKEISKVVEIFGPKN